MRNRNPNQLTGWELLILLVATALLCLSIDERAPGVTVIVNQKPYEVTR